MSDHGVVVAGLVSAPDDAGWIRRLRELHLLTPLRILIIVIIAVLLTLLLRVVVARFIRGLQRAHERVAYRVDHDRIDQRRRTITTVLTSTAVGLVWITAVITVLGEVGVNLGAFVATATIIGGALAFGAQTLVRDLIAGFFMIAEDQLGVGDVVDLGTATGTVERVSLRITQVRDDDGRVWYMPNGQITRVANYSQGPVAITVDIAVSLQQDLAAVGATVCGLGRSLAADARVGQYLAGEPEYLGVEDLDDDRAVLRFRLTCRVEGRHQVRRAFLAAVAAAERAGQVRGIDVEPDEPGRRAAESGSGETGPV